MAVVPVTINGVAFPKNKKDPPFPVTIVGYAWITGLHPDQSPPGSQPHPEHPIVIVPPENPGDPPQIWGPNDPRPTPPIHLPPEGEIPPLPDEGPLDKLLTLVAKEPPAEGGWGWFPEYGWVYSPGEGQAGPKRGR